MTEDEISHTVICHLLNQGQRSRSHTTCRYRTRDGNLSCAVGCLLSDELATEIENEYPEGAPVQDILHMLPHDLQKHAALLERLQDLHDYPSNWNENGFIVNPVSSEKPQGVELELIATWRAYKEGRLLAQVPFDETIASLSPSFELAPFNQPWTELCSYHQQWFTGVMELDGVGARDYHDLFRISLGMPPLPRLTDSIREELESLSEQQSPYQRFEFTPPLFLDGIGRSRFWHHVIATIDPSNSNQEPIA